jgi:hypothetical protein
MGPAYFPTVLGGLLAVVGTIAVIRSFIVPGTPIGAFAFKGLVLVCTPVLLFGIIVRGAGLAVALPLLVVISASASVRFRWRGTLIIAAASQSFAFSCFLRLRHPLPVLGPGSAVEGKRGADNHGINGHLLLGCRRRYSSQLVLLLHRCFSRHCHWCFAWPGTDGNHRDALPVTFVLPPVSALIMLAGIYYGSQYGGSTTSILVNLPGEAASVITTLDGYQMAKQGRAGAALAASAIGSFFAGTVATFLIAGFGPPLAAMALKFGPAEFFS